AALIDARKAVALSPLSVDAIAELARALFYARRTDEALAELAKLRALRPAVQRVHELGARIYEAKQMWPEAIAELEASSGVNAPRIAERGRVLAASGDEAGARRVLAELLAGWRRGSVKAQEIATLYAGLHE